MILLWIVLIDAASHTGSSAHRTGVVQGRPPIHHPSVWACKRGNSDHESRHVETMRDETNARPHYLSGCAAWTARGISHKVLGQATLRLRGGKLRDEARSGGKLSDVIGPRGVFIRQKGMVTSEAHGRGAADKMQQKRFLRKERAAKIADANRLRKLQKLHAQQVAVDQEVIAPGAGEVMFAADGEALKEQQTQKDDPFAWLEKQLDMAENTGAEVPTIQDALKRHVPVADEQAAEEDSSDLGTSSSSTDSAATHDSNSDSDWQQAQKTKGGMSKLFSMAR